MRADLIGSLALAALAGLTAGAAMAQSVDRLPRETFDVIPPGERVQGERGHFTAWQTACRVGPTETARRRIVDIAAQEWGVFGFQTIDRSVVETRRLPEGLVADAVNPQLDQPRAGRAYPRLGRWESSSALADDIAGYWTATSEAKEVLREQNRAWNGPGGDAMNWIQPWSAAFISWVMCEAGLGEESQFRRAIAHWEYIDQAIAARNGDAPGAAFVAYDAGEQPVTPGDMLCNARGSADYRAIADRRPDMGEYAPLHCDIVVRVDQRGERILVIGGNATQSVSLAILPAARNGDLLRPIGEADLEGATTIFAHLKLQAPPIEDAALDNTPTVRALGRE